MPEQQFVASRSQPVSVVVCTRDRADLLQACLAALTTQTHADLEIIVIDNAPTDERTAALCGQLPVRYIRESRRGLARARNRGISEARHDLIAFTDDDAIPDVHWAAAVAEAFREDCVMAVTGRVAAAPLTTKAQRHFELDAGGMSKGDQRRDFARARMSDVELVQVQDCGVGANMAFRRSTFGRVGQFDPLLGAGTAARGGEDLDMFHRVLAAGLLLRYEPAALVLHHHRADMAALARQLFDTGCGFGAYLLSLLSKGTVPRASVIRYGGGTWLPWLGGRLVKRMLGRHPLPLRLLWAQLAGAVVSPFAFRAARRASL